MAKQPSIFLLFALIFCGQFSARDARIGVQGDFGNIIGTYKDVTINGSIHTVYMYLGIPYAKPPIGDLRFRKPEPLVNVPVNPYNGTYMRSACHQFPSIVSQSIFMPESEDCLYLNIYIPSADADQSSGHAVMIWIFGGGYDSGSADQYNMEYFAAFGNVMVVTFNYRLGIFGFLSTNDEYAVGNYGLWDQRLVFQWVKNHVADFGGDPNRVTIFGESAGAFSCSLHALSPMNHNLFQRVITQSGSAWSLFYNVSMDTRAVAMDIAYNVGCSPDSYDMEELVRCLRDKSVQTLKNAVLTSREGDEKSSFIMFLPKVDGQLIKANPRDGKQLENTDALQFFGSLDYLNGINKYEGVYALYVLGVEDLNAFRPLPESMANLFIPSVMEVIFHRQFPMEIQQLVLNRYSDWGDPLNPENIRKEFVRLFGDAAANAPGVHTTRLHHRHEYDNGAGNYLYHFVALPPFHVMNTPMWIDGANHADELLFMMGMENFPGHTQWQVKLSFTMMRYWSSFAKTGSPNDINGTDPIWPPFDDKEEYYLEFSEVMNNDSIKHHLYAGETDFWMKVFPQLIKAFNKMEMAQNMTCTSAAASFGLVFEFLFLSFTCSFLFL